MMQMHFAMIKLLSSVESQKIIANKTIIVQVQQINTLKKRPAIKAERFFVIYPQKNREKRVKNCKGVFDSAFIIPKRKRFTRHQRRWFWVRHLGDITKINGAEIEPVWVITGGSPC